MVLRGGPFDGEQVGFLPPDTPAPLDIVWNGWFPWGFCSYRYRLHQGEVLMDCGRVTGLLYRFEARALHDPPPVVAQDADLYADAADLLLFLRGFPGVVEKLQDTKNHWSQWLG